MDLPLFFDKKPARDFGDLVTSYDVGEFASPTRSTVPLLALLKDGAPRFRRILENLGMTREADLHMEFKVNPPRGTGRPSQTDLMARASDNAIAIEAKWTEPRYPNVSQRAASDSEDAGDSKDRDDSNRSDVIQGWIDLIQPRVSKPLRREEFGDCVYQLLHRAASACATATHPVLAYMIFSEHAKTSHDAGRKDFYRADLAHLHSVLGHPAGFPFYLVNLELKPTAAFREIKPLRKGAESTAERVRRALLGEELFEFGVPTITKIRESGAQSRSNGST